MPITYSVLTSGVIETDGASFTTPSISPAADKHITVLLEARHVNVADTPPVPTVSGNGGTYTSRASSAVWGNNRRVFCQTRQVAAPSAGAITVDFGADSQRHLQYCVVESTGADLADAFIQAVANTIASDAALTVTLAALADALNSGVLYGQAAANTEAQAPGGSYSELFESAGADSTIFAVAGLVPGTTTPSYSSASAAARGGAAEEVRALLGNRRTGVSAGNIRR